MQHGEIPGREKGGRGRGPERQPADNAWLIVLRVGCRIIWHGLVFGDLKADNGGPRMFDRDTVPSQSEPGGGR